MAEQKESSVLFSLKELMNLEEDRIKQEDDDEEAPGSRPRCRPRVEAERRAREAEEARMRAEDERRRRKSSAPREEQARLEAIRQGEVEKARLEAEQQARLRAMAQQQEHERQLAALTQDKRQEDSSRTIAVGIGAVLDPRRSSAAATPSRAQSDKARPRQRRRTREIAEQKAQLDKLMARASEQSANDRARCRPPAERRQGRRRRQARRRQAKPLARRRSNSAADAKQRGSVGAPHGPGGCAAATRAPPAVASRCKSARPSDPALDLDAVAVDRHDARSTHRCLRSIIRAVDEARAGGARRARRAIGMIKVGLELFVARGARGGRARRARSGCPSSSI